MSEYQIKQRNSIANQAEAAALKNNQSSKNATWNSTEMIDQISKPNSSTKGRHQSKRISPDVGLAEEVNDVSSIGFADDDKLSERSLDIVPPLLSYNDRCEEHPSELIVAYNKVTLLHLCSQCIGSQNLIKEDYIVYPQIV